MDLAYRIWLLYSLLSVTSLMVYGRIHTLPLTNDERTVVVMTSFGYLEDGSLEVNITNLKMTGSAKRDFKVGFSLDKSSSSGSSGYVEREQSSHGCVLDKKNDDMYKDVPRAILMITPKEGEEEGDLYELKISERALYDLKFYSSYSDYRTSLTEEGKGNPVTEETNVVHTGAGTDASEETKQGVTEAAKGGEEVKPDESAPASRRKRAPVAETDSEEDKTQEFVDVEKPLSIKGNFHDGMNISFYMKIEHKDQIGLYELYFHNCENLLSYDTDIAKLSKVAMTAHIVEMNGGSYLSAGDIALPTMYGVIAVMFFLCGFVWLNVICKTNEKVFNIHYLMGVIVLVKGLSVMFHSLDYYFIAKDGHTEAWAVIYYIVHLLKGILLIICLLLIGSGWAFIKYILSDRDKKLFMIVIPMQVMANVAYIIMEETEEGNKSYYTWKDIMILVDVLCCGAILIPVVWSIRHLQEASQTDGKAAINLSKLVLFRHFYILVVCYLYFTRIIVYLLEITLPFHYVWIHALFSEIGAFIFFSVTGYKFRPGCDNPYLKLDQYDSDEDPEEAITQSGATETISKVNQHQKEVQDTDEFDVLLPKQRTSKV